MVLRRWKRWRICSLLRRGSLKVWLAGGDIDEYGGLLVIRSLNVVFFTVESSGCVKSWKGRWVTGFV